MKKGRPGWKFTALADESRRHAIVQFLLEESRVVAQASNERNFNVFYQIATAAGMDLDSFHYLTHGRAPTADTTIDDAVEYEALMAAFTALGVARSSVDSVLRVVRGLLWLGNVQIVAVDPDDADSRVRVDADQPALAECCEALGLDPALRSELDRQAAAAD